MSSPAGFGRPVSRSSSGGGGGGDMNNPMTNVGDVISASVAGTPATPVRIPAVATGSVFASNGVDTLPSWQVFATLAAAWLVGALGSSGAFPYRTAAGALGASLQGTSALSLYAIDWQIADRFTKSLSGGDTFTHTNTEAKMAIRLVLTVNGQSQPAGLGTQIGGETWSSAWLTAYVWIAKNGSGGYEFTLSGA